jgi:hypothetical protein
MSYFSIFKFLLVISVTMEIINSNKNNNKLCYEGYMLYIRKHTGKSRITWRCSKATMIKCPGTIYTNIEKSKILEIGTSHIITHRPNTNEVKVSKCYNEMKIQAKTTKTNIVILCARFKIVYYTV